MQQCSVFFIIFSEHVTMMRIENEKQQPGKYLLCGVQLTEQKKKKYVERQKSEKSV